MRNKDKDSYIKFLAFIDILIKNSDENHPMKVQDIKDKLYELDYDFSIDFRMINKYVHYYNTYYEDTLIESYKEGRNVYYYFVNTLLDSMEAKAIIDLVDSSDFFTLKTKQNYKKRISDMFSIHYQAYFRKAFNLHINKNENDQVFYKELETITEAIHQKKKIKFIYKKPQLNKQIKPKETIIGPIDTCFQNNEYYLICQGNKNPDQCIRYRLDYVTDVEIVEDSKVEYTSRQLDQMHETLKNMTYMYGDGDIQSIELEFEDDVYSNMIDKFGKHIKPRQIDEHHYRVQVQHIINHTFYSWIVGFGGKIQIIGNDNQVKQFKEFIQKFV